MFKNIKAILHKNVKNAGISRQVEEKRVLSLFKEGIGGLLGPDLARQVKVLYIKNKVIALACLSVQAAEIIRKNEKEIFDIINSDIGKIVIEKARYLT